MRTEKLPVHTTFVKLHFEIKICTTTNTITLIRRNYKNFTHTHTLHSATEHCTHTVNPKVLSTQTV